MKKKILSMALAVALVLGLAVPVLAVGPTFSDVPESHWAYADVEAVAAQGLMNGTGNGAFSPEMKVSVAQFLTLLGRLVFPETKVSEGDSWFGPYVAKAQEAGLLAGTQVNVNDVDAEISRYDMAVILRAAAKKLGVAEKAAQSSEVTDYGMVPTMYADSVLAVYGMGLIKGDQVGNFNGSNTMMRSEVATVIMRLAKAKPGSSQGGATEPTASPEPSANPEVTPSPVPEIPTEPREPQMVSARVRGSMRYYPTQGKAEWHDGETKLIMDPIPFKLLYTTDGGLTSQTVLEGQTKDYELRLEFSVDKAMLDDPNGQFYISAQYEKDGQIFVTQDLRTDGRKALSIAHVTEQGRMTKDSPIRLVPPTGQKWDFELKGKVPDMAMAFVATTGPNIPPDLHKISPAGFTVQLAYYPDPIIQDGFPTGERIVVAETTAREDGTFVLPVSIDTVDVTNTLGAKNFCIEFSGVYNGVEYFSLDTESLRTLSDIKSTKINAAWFVNLYHN